MIAETAAVVRTAETVAGAEIVETVAGAEIVEIAAGAEIVEIAADVTGIGVGVAARRARSVPHGRSALSASSRASLLLAPPRGPWGPMETSSWA
jgi:hypothetical protein